MDAEDAGVPEPPALADTAKPLDVSSRKVPSRSVPGTVPVRTEPTPCQLVSRPVRLKNSGRLAHVGVALVGGPRGRW